MFAAQLDGKLDCRSDAVPVPEDVLVYSRLAAIANEVGLEASSVFDLSLSQRGPVELVYYTMLRRLPLLK